jgi:hypothetical protein
MTSGIDKPQLSGDAIPDEGHWQRRGHIDNRQK